MTTYANAAPPPGALFDNAPTVAPAQPHRKTSDDYTPCVAVWPSGKTQRANVRRIRLDSVESARAKLGDGLVAWVRESDVEAVVRGGGKEGDGSQ